MARRRIRRATIGKKPIQHAHTNVATIGGATAPASFIVLNPEIGARSTTGAGQTYSADRDTQETVNIGDVVKYIHLFGQCSPREGVNTLDDRHGWLEWAFVCCKQSDTAVPITNLGTLTLGNVCTNMFRNECIYTGNIAIGSSQSNSFDAYIKIPKFKQTIRAGDEWRFITYFRDSKATSTATDAMRVIKSYIYKAYE